MKNKLNKIFSLLKKKGLIYTFNRIHFALFFNTKNPLLIKFLYLTNPYPSYIEVETTTACDLKCTICEHTYWKEPIYNMTFSQFKSIIDQFPKLKWIGLTSIGESFLNPDFIKIIEYVKSKNIYVEIYDNLYFLDKNTIEKLINLQIDKIFISLDGATKETYEKIRVGANFDKAVENIKYLINFKKDSNSFIPEIAFHFVINKENISEINQFIDFTYSITGKDTKIQFSQLLHNFKEVEKLFIRIPRLIIKDADTKARKLGIKLSWNEDASLKKADIKKCTQWIMPFIFATGEVIPCCAKNEANQRNLQKQTSMGNIFQTPFKKIWNGEKYKNLRKTILMSKTPVQCENCPLYENCN